MKKLNIERHSIATLAQRFRGLISRNTVESWLIEGRLKFEAGPSPVINPKQKKGERFWLFKTDYLDQLTLQLEARHDERVRRQLGNDAGARAIRDSARREALGIIEANVNQFGGRKVFISERDPALNDGDAIGRTYMTDRRPRTSIQGGWITKP